MLRRMADKMEEDPVFAQQILGESKAIRQAGLKKSTKAGNKQAHKAPSKLTSEPLPEMSEKAVALPDIYALYIEGKEERLRDCLEQCEPEILKAIVSKNHLDPSGKVIRWKTKKKLVEFIISTVDNRLAQGDAFKSPENK